MTSHHSALGENGLMPSRSCQFCPNTQLDTETVISFGERICRHCKSVRSDYQGIVKSKAKKEFLLSDKSFARLNYVEKLNPRNASFKPMKIYLRKHVKELAILLYGSLERIQDEKAKRLKNASKRKRKKRRCLNDFTSSSSKKEMINEGKLNDKELTEQNNPFKKLKSMRTFASRGSENRSKKPRKERKKFFFPEDHVHRFKSVSSAPDASGKTVERCECGYEREVEEM